MDELDQRIEVLHQAGIIDEIGKADLGKIIQILTIDYGIDRNSELLGSLVTHIAASFKRLREGEKIVPIAREVLADVKSNEFYPKSLEIEKKIANSITNKISVDEEEFILVHIAGLLTAAQTD